MVDADTGPREEAFVRARTAILGLVDRAFGPESNPPLEDLFTLLDHAISRREYYLGEPWNVLENVRRNFSLALMFAINRATDRAPRTARTFYRSLAADLLDQRLAAHQKGDPFSFILVNWDCLLENSLYWCLREAGGFRRADVDYCCYTSPLDVTSPHQPSILQRALGIFNIKVIKLHGSTNWLLCPNCNRMYTGLGGNHEQQHSYVVPQYCPKCSPGGASGAEEGGVGSPELTPFLITPTFLKVFDNPHIQTSWHNAQIELAEAARVVFIGYSLPQADYHFRTLLRRAIRGDINVEVVLTPADRPARNCPRVARPAYAAYRYAEFFGEDRLTIHLQGTEGYFRPVVARDSLKGKLERLRRRFGHLPAPRN